jgi:hypothetical protein
MPMLVVMEIIKVLSGPRKISPSLLALEPHEVISELLLEIDINALPNSYGTPGPYRAD